jgi:PAS domain S-box-containing protein
MTFDQKNATRRILELEAMNKRLERQVQENKVGRQFKRAARKDWEKTVDAIEDWICIIDLDSVILRSNRTVEKYFQLRVQEAIGLKCCKLFHGTDQPVESCPLPKMIRSKKRESAEVEIQEGRWMLISVDPLFNGAGEIIKAVHITRDITQRILIQNEREILVKELKDALARIKTLDGLIPICSICKKIRDDRGYWNLIESYIESHSDAAFSHGICPDCSDGLYGKEDWYIDMKKKKNQKK